MRNLCVSVRAIWSLKLRPTLGRLVEERHPSMRNSGMNDVHTSYGRNEERERQRKQEKGNGKGKSAPRAINDDRDGRNRRDILVEM